MVKVEIDSIRVSLMSQDRVIVLKDSASERYLPIWIGPPEADAIRVELQGVEAARPFTHDLLKSVILQLGGEVEQILINDLRNDTFYARIEVKASGKIIEVDSRPSDAIALAVRVKVPIFVEDSVMDRASITPEDDITTEMNMPGSGKEGETPASTSPEDMGAFTDFLESLDLDDLDDASKSGSA